MFTVIANNGQHIAEESDAMNASAVAQCYPGAHIKVFTAAEKLPDVTDAVAMLAVLRDAATGYMHVMEHGIDKQRDSAYNELQAAMDDADKIIQQFP